MADIIQFPSKKPTTITISASNKYQETKYKLDTDELVNTTYTLKGKPVDYPKDQTAYLQICKEFMEEAEYKLILLGIMDSDYFESLRPELQLIVACYYELGEKR